MPAVNTSGSQTATLTTEHTLATVTDAGTYQLSVDTALLVNDETLELRIYGKARTSDTERLMLISSFKHIQGTPLKISIPVMSPHYFKATLEQNGGTGRAFPWAIYEV